MISTEETQKQASVTALVLSGLILWLALVFVLGAGGAFARAPGRLPLPILIGATGPIIAFVTMFWLSPTFRDFVLSLDLRLMTGIQAWRFAGLGFLALYVHGVLPGLFAWPAGVGDIVIGVTAPFVLLALIRRPSFAGSRLFTVWNQLGILDLAVAVGTGALSSALAIGVYGEITTGPMARLPLVLIPAYFVPLFVMLHIAALFQARQLAAPSLGIGR
ncbi:MAG TPA: hypothetical protein VFU31_23935 [Candidatus Binatia bacterium]|nr:hypothetical protein [Candidatus Binatia bacterium]